MTERWLVLKRRIASGDRTCVSKDWVLCPFLINMGGSFAKCGSFDDTLIVRKVLKGLPIAQRSKTCMDAEFFCKTLDNFCAE